VWWFDIALIVVCCYGLFVIFLFYGVSFSRYVLFCCDVLFHFRVIIVVVCPQSSCFYFRVPRYVQEKNVKVRTKLPLTAPSDNWRSKRKYVPPVDPGIPFPFAGEQKLYAIY